MYHVPLVPRDADREETMFRIDQALTKLVQVRGNSGAHVKNLKIRLREKTGSRDFGKKKFFSEFFNFFKSKTLNQKLKLQLSDKLSFFLISIF